MFTAHVWNEKTLKNEPVVMGVGTTVAVSTRWMGGFFAHTMDYSISVEHLYAVHFDREKGEFVSTFVDRGVECREALTDAQKAGVVVDAPAGLLADYAAHLENLEYARRRAQACKAGCIVMNHALAVVFKGAKVAPGVLGRTFWINKDSGRLGLDPRPAGSPGKAENPVWVDGSNACAVPADLVASLRPDELHGRPDWALGFERALPGSVGAPEAFAFMLSLAETPEKLEALRLLGEALRTRPAPAGDKKACAAQAELVDGVAVRIGFRKPRPVAPAREKKPRARKTKAEQAAAAG